MQNLVYSNRIDRCREDIFQLAIPKHWNADSNCRPSDRPNEVIHHCRSERICNLIVTCRLDGCRAWHATRERRMEKVLAGGISHDHCSPSRLAWQNANHVLMKIPKIFLIDQFGGRESFQCPDASLQLAINRT